MADLSLDVEVEAGDWQALDPDCKRFVFSVLSASLAHVQTPDVEISVLLTDDDHQRILNAQWRNLDKSTNVLSFPSGEDQAHPGQALFLGDISVACETVQREAEDQHKSFSDHLSHLLVHGLLHLLGYDHLEDAHAEDMETLEVEILKAMGLNSPYVDRS